MRCLHAFGGNLQRHGQVGLVHREEHRSKLSEQAGRPSVKQVDEMIELKQKQHMEMVDMKRLKNEQEQVNMMRQILFADIKLKMKYL